MHEVDSKVERWVGEFTREKIRKHDFDESSALYHLHKINLIEVKNHRIYVKPMKEALKSLQEQIVDPDNGVYSSKHDLEWNSLLKKSPMSDDY